MNQGIGTSAIAEFIDLIKTREDPRRVIVGPDPRNLREIRCYEKVGFKYLHTVKGEDRTMSYMMRVGL